MINNLHTTAILFVSNIPGNEEQLQTDNFYNKLIGQTIGYTFLVVFILFAIFILVYEFYLVPKVFNKKHKEIVSNIKIKKEETFSDKTLRFLTSSYKELLDNNEDGSNKKEVIDDVTITNVNIKSKSTTRKKSSDSTKKKEANEENNRNKTTNKTTKIKTEKDNKNSVRKEKTTPTKKVDTINKTETKKK